MTAIVHVVPTAYSDYGIELSTTLSTFVQSGIATAYPGISALVAAMGGGGQVVHLPHWSDLDGDDAPTPDGEAGNALSATDMAGTEQVGVLLRRSKVWRGTVLSAWMAGDDPLMALVSRVAAYRARREQTALFAVLNGLFGSGGCLRSTHLLDVATGGRALTPEAIGEGGQLLGDAQGQIRAIAMHSAKATSLKLAGYIREPAQIQATAEGAPAPFLETVDGKRVVVDDSCPYDSATGVYRSYLFAPGAVARADVARPSGVDEYESDSDILTKAKYLGYNWGFMLHVNGTSWGGSTAAAAQTNALLATAASWSKVYADKNIPVLAIESK
jgi:hypothetical protein